MCVSLTRAAICFVLSRLIAPNIWHLVTAVLCGTRNIDRPGATARGSAMCGTGNMDRPGATNQGYRCYGNESKRVHTYQPAPGQSLSSAGALISLHLAGEVAQLVERLATIHKTLDGIPSTT